VKDAAGHIAILTLDDNLQKILDSEIEETLAPHIAVVVSDVWSGKILAYKGKSISISNPVSYSGYRAASLFKIVTAAAAFDFKLLKPQDRIFFRGSIYDLSEWNYLPNPYLDKISLPIDIGLAKSVNPLFGRIALNFLNPTFLSFYSDRFGFNWRLPADFEIKESRAFIPEDNYQFARTAAGFGSVFISPVHSAALIAALGNNGKLMRPSIIDTVLDKSGRVVYKFQPHAVSQVVQSSAAQELLQSMALTQTEGTASKAFSGSTIAHLVAGKTGTLRNDSPPGLLLSYIATFPISKPKYAICVIVINAQNSHSKASFIARRIIEAIMLK
jgi:cell division protein FtsI/penicillin-binding protein 2